MRWRKVSHCDVAGGLVRDERVFGGVLAVVSGGEFGQVAVVIALHFVVEHLALAGRRARDQMFVEHFQDVGADVAQFLLDLRAVVFDHLQLLFDALWKPDGTESDDRKEYQLKSVRFEETLG